MKNLLLLVTFLLLTFNASYSQKVKKTPEFSMSKIEAEAQLRFLASDEMLGRRTGSVTNRLAARYIAETFRSLGLKPANGQSDYLQKVELDVVKSLKKGEIINGADTLKIGKDFVVFGGYDPTLINEANVVFVGYGWKDDLKNYNDYKDIDVKGKIVIAQTGTPDSSSPNEMFSAATKKRKIAQENGAVGLIEIFTATIPWNIVSGYFNGESMALTDSKDAKRLPHYWVSLQAAKNLKKETLKTITVHVPAREKSPITTHNVMGILEGTDAILKNEYVVLSAHYDHVGVGKEGGNAYKEDSIFNGTRDNAFGTTAMLQAAKAFSILKPKRSILFIAYTGEEVGLLGSKYYSENPVVPLKDCVYNLNCDGAGYNDTTKITVIGLSRTDVKAELETACKAFGLTAIDDPAPEQNLFDRSDNVSLAAKGIPAPTYSPGFIKFDDDVYKYYHQAIDNPESIDVAYFLKYCKIYAYAARLIANRPNRPKWIVGDKYEAAFNSLYTKK